MKDFISKVTFGFFMAQFLPGAVVVFALSCAAETLSSCAPGGILEGASDVLEFWFGTAMSTVVFLFIAVALGMIIHGLNWTVLAWLENRICPSDPKPVRNARWHSVHLWKQLLIGPPVMIFELLYLLVRAPNLDHLTMDENVSCLRADQMSQFQFLQDFYLHFGQFYAHTAYALLTALICGMFCCICAFSWTKALITLGLYLTTSVFFLMGRIQLGSLFKAEDKLTEQSTSTAAGQ